MSIEVLERAYHDRPFRSFIMHLADGRSLPVPRPEFLAFGGLGRTAVVMDEGDEWRVIDLLSVVGLSFEGEPAASER